MKQRILLTGKDGIDLLQRITTLDFQRISTDHFHPGLVLNPQGKILCYFEVKKTEVSHQLEINFQDSLIELLDLYTFAEKYQIHPLPPFPENTDPALELQRIKMKIPKIGNEFLNNGETNPLEINLISAIHDQKGCYPGQEVIEKIISLGSPAKQLCLVKCLELNPKDLQLPFELDFGKVTSYEGNLGLAIVRKTHTKPGTILHGINYSFQVMEQ